MNVFEKILGKISAKNLTDTKGNSQNLQTREVSTTENREIKS